jgi:dienelactone hydrolase
MKVIGDRLAKEGYAVYYVDFDKNRAEAKTEGITKVPIAIVMRDGKEVRRITGITRRNESSVESEIRKNLRKNKIPDNYVIY